jgi:hypothetical protein
MAEKDPGPTRASRTPTIITTIAFTLLLSALLYSGWRLLKYPYYPLIFGYIQKAIEINLSTLQIGIASAGLTGLVGSLLLTRRRSRPSKNAQPTPLKMTPMTFGTAEVVHPLLMTQRPARDAKFVIRKTRNPGRISRNRMGERLPPSNVAEPEIDRPQ